MTKLPTTMPFDTKYKYIIELSFFVGLSRFESGLGVAIRRFHGIVLGDPVVLVVVGHVNDNQCGNQHEAEERRVDNEADKGTDVVFGHDSVRYSLTDGFTCTEYTGHARIGLHIGSKT